MLLPTAALCLSLCACTSEAELAQIGTLLSTAEEAVQTVQSVGDSLQQTSKTNKPDIIGTFLSSLLEVPETAEAPTDIHTELPEAVDNTEDTAHEPASAVLKTAKKSEAADLPANSLSADTAAEDTQSDGPTDKVETETPVETQTISQPEPVAEEPDDPIESTSAQDSSPTPTVAEPTPSTVEADIPLTPEESSTPAPEEDTTIPFEEDATPSVEDNSIDFGGGIPLTPSDTGTFSLS